MDLNMTISKNSQVNTEKLICTLSAENFSRDVLLQAPHTGWKSFKDLRRQ
jgi:hypothetical protein